MTPPIRRKVEAIATQMNTPVADIMAQLGLPPRDRSEVTCIVNDRRRKKA